MLDLLNNLCLSIGDPLLGWLLRLPNHLAIVIVAVATSANQVVASSVSGVLAHLKRRTVDLRMGLVLLAGGLIGSAAGVQVFNMLRQAGQVDLLVQLSYVVFLGTVGALMFVESLNALRRSRSGKPPVRRKHHWVHALPLKIKFRTSMDIYWSRC